jgi:hypothetical protein
MENICAHACSAHTSSIMTVMDILSYSLYREQTFFAGVFLIPASSLVILPGLQRLYDEDHAKNCMEMYAADVDVRSGNPLECVIPLEAKDTVSAWLAKQDPTKLGKFQPTDLLVLDVPQISFPIIKGQHRYKAYCLALAAEGVLPQGAPHPECLAVRLFYSGAFFCHAALIYALINVNRP